MIPNSSNIDSSKPSDKPGILVRTGKRKNGRFKAIGKVALLFVRSKNKSKSKKQSAKKSTLGSKQLKKDVAMLSNSTDLTSDLSILEDEAVEPKGETKTDKPTLDKDDVVDPKRELKTDKTLELTIDTKILADEEVFYDTEVGEDKDWIATEELTKAPEFSRRDLHKIRKAVIATIELSLLLTLYFQDRTILDWHEKMQSLLIENNQKESKSIIQLGRMVLYDPSATMNVQAKDAIVGLHNVVRFNQRILFEHNNIIVSNIGKVSALQHGIKTVLIHRHDTLALLGGQSIHP